MTKPLPLKNAEWLFLLVIALAVMACTRRQESAVMPWQSGGEAESGAAFDLPSIEKAGEMIALTVSGPETYYEHHGRQMGLQYLICQHFAQHIGVRLRIEVCRDTAEVIARMQAGDGDLGLLRMDADTLSPGWIVGPEKEMLKQELAAWYKPTMTTEARQEEKQMLASPRVKRRVFAPMLGPGVISHYDNMFKHYSRSLGWDWRLIAAQCYQESTFDPNAVSWAGAVGLMQIMPTTADHLGLARGDMTNPEKNIAAATKLLAELERDFSYIHNRIERQNMVLASYNGGIGHVRDAMRLAERDRKNPQRWADVKTYILKLSQPQYYQDSLVRHGYMRGTETAEYVDRIRSRYDQYTLKTKR